MTDDSATSGTPPESPASEISPDDEARTRTPAGSSSFGSDRHVRFVAVLVGIGAVLILAVGAAFAAVGDDDTAAETDDGWGGTLLGEPVERPDFTLTDTEGQPFDFRDETEGQLTLLFFGFTNCPDVCPVQMAVLASALRQPNMPEPTVVFVTTDPERDTPERLRSFLDQFDPRFIGLTGTAEEVAAAERAAEVAPSTRWSEDGGPATDDEDDYDVFHASQVIAFTPDDLAHVVYPQGVRQQDWVDDLARLPQEFPAR